MLAGQPLQTKRRDSFVGVEAQPTEVSNALRLYRDTFFFELVFYFSVCFCLRRAKEMVEG